jgi:hypothetical protein
MIKMRCLAAFFLLMSCGGLEQMKQDRLIAKYFPDAAMASSLKCILKKGAGPKSGCPLKKEHLVYSNPAFKGSPTMLEYVLEWGDKKTNPETLYHMIKAGAEPAQVVSSVVFGDDLELFKALVKAVGGPNVRLHSPSSYQSIMYAAITHWHTDEKIDYLQSVGVDWEELEPVSGDTAILDASLNGLTSSEFHKVNKLLDYGANPRALDNDGRGLCDFIKNKYTRWDKQFPDQRAKLTQRLRTQYGMICP